MKTYHPGEGSIKKKWFVVDAEGKTLGRLSSGIATVLRGKHKPTYTPSLDIGDFVIVINADKIGVTGKKLEDKVYYSHSSYPGGLKTVPFSKLLAERPEEIIRRAVRGMLPKGSLGRALNKKLKVYAGTEHPHEAQSPEEFPKRLAG